jgi:hypothetical protein
MNLSSSVEAGLSDGEAAWNAAFVEAEYARRDYAQCLRASDRDESELGRLWMHLWLAEGRRDELFRQLK